MLVFRIHIALFMLTGFLFPQAVNSVHYFIIPHTFDKTHGGEKLSMPAYDYHHCDYKITGWNYQVPLLGKEPFSSFTEQGVKPLFANSFILINAEEFSYSLRGPPQIHPPMQQIIFTYQIII